MSERRPEPAPTCLLCGATGRGACQCDHGDRGARSATNRCEHGGADDYDPFEYVPERISPITASGLAWLDDQLTEENKALLRSLPIERQASVLAELIETGAIGVRPEVVRDLLDAGAIRPSDEETTTREDDR